MTVIISFQNEDDFHFEKWVLIISERTSFRNVPVRFTTAPTRHRIVSEPYSVATREWNRFSDRQLKTAVRGVTKQS